MFTFYLWALCYALAVLGILLATAALLRADDMVLVSIAAISSLV